MPNLPPNVKAGQNIRATTADVVQLNGVVTDDGLPNSPGVVTSTWLLISGTPDVTFANSTSPRTTATFNAPGVYILQLTATDGELSSSSTVTVQIIDTYRIELKAWIPQAKVVDPLLISSFKFENITIPLLQEPLRSCFAAASGIRQKGAVQVLKSEFNGNNHTDYGMIGDQPPGNGDFKVRTWVEFEFDGSQILNFRRGGSYSRTYRTILVESPNGVQQLCVQNAIEDISSLPLGEKVNSNTVRMAVAGANPLTPDLKQFTVLRGIVCPVGDFDPRIAPGCSFAYSALEKSPIFTPPINGEAEISVDNRGNVTVNYTTDFFPSYGIAVQRNAIFWTKLLNNASCAPTTSYRGAAELYVRLLGVTRTSGTVTIGSPEAACVRSVDKNAVKLTAQALRTGIRRETEGLLLILGSYLPRGILK